MEESDFTYSTDDTGEDEMEISTTSEESEEMQPHILLTTETLIFLQDSLNNKETRDYRQLLKDISRYSHSTITPFYSNNLDKRDMIELQDQDVNLPLLFELAFIQLPASLSDAYKLGKQSKKWDPSLSPHIKIILELCILVLTKAPLNSWQYDFLTRRSLEHLQPFFILFPTLLKSLVTQLASRWTECPVNEDFQPNLLAFVHLNRFSYIEARRLLVMKCAYDAFGKSCSDQIVSHNTPHVNFMMKCLIELLQSSKSQALYECGLSSIKALALPINKALHEPKLEHLSIIPSWSFVLKAAVWSNILAKKHKDPVIRPLFYPLIQCILCALQATSTMSQFFPFHIHLCYIMIHIMQTCGDIHIPLENRLLFMFQQVKNVGKKSEKALKPVAFPTTIKVEGAYEHTQLYYQNVADQTFTLFEMISELMTDRTCFIEWAEMMVQRLGALKKGSSVFLSKKIDGAVEQLKKRLGTWKMDNAINSIDGFPYFVSGDHKKTCEKHRFYLISE